MDNSGQVGNTLRTGDINKTPDIEVPFRTPPAPQIQPNQMTSETSPEQQSVSVEQADLPTVELLNPQDSNTPPEVALTPAAQTMEEQNPEIAVDGNKIEQSWVHKTEEVVKQYSDDPRREEIEKNRLSDDYLWKRFKRRRGDRN